METIFTEIGKSYTAGKEAEYRKIFEKAEYEKLPIKEAGFSQGFAVKEAIKEYEIPAQSVSFYNGIDSFGIYGIETKEQRIYFLDIGTAIVPIALQNIKVIK